MMLWIVVPLLAAATHGARLPYIVGGRSVEQRGAYPWQGSLQHYGSHECGVSLLSPHWSLTAAHCVGVPVSMLGMIYGLLDKRDMVGAISLRPDKVRVHPRFMRGMGKMPHDIALIHSVDPLNAKKYAYISTIALADKNDSYEGETCVITGWGSTTGNRADLPNVLQEANMTVLSRAQCSEVVPPEDLNDGHVCVVNPWSTGCMGDSGGPLSCKRGDTWRLVGVTSWGLGCSTSVPAVYSKVTYFRPWIREISGL